MSSTDDLVRTDADGRTPLHLAYLRSRHESMNLIGDLRAQGADPLARDKDGRTPLMLAMSLPVPVKRAWILIKGATPEELLATDHEGRDAYDLCRESGLSIADETWAERMPKPWKKFNLAVLAAVCNLETLKKAILAGRGLSDLNSKGQTCLFASLCNPQPEVFPFILSLHPDLELRDPAGRTVLFQTVSNTSHPLEETRQLLNAGISVHSKDHLGITPLHLAVRSRNLRVIEALLAFGARADTEDQSGETPFELACRFNTSSDILKALLKKVPRPQQELLLQRGLRRALGACVEREVVLTLVRFGANLNEELLAYAREWKYWRDVNLG